jgi:hypothetical protein
VDHSNHWKIIGSGILLHWHIVKYFYKYFSTGATNSFEGTGLGLLVSRVLSKPSGQNIGENDVDTEIAVRLDLLHNT